MSSPSVRLPGRRLTVAVTVAVVACVVAASPAGPLPAGAQSPFPERDGIVANGTDQGLSAARINNDFRDLLGDRYDLRGLVLVVDDCRPDPEVYLDDALVHYGLASGPGEMDNDAVAWLVCTEPRHVDFSYPRDLPNADRLDYQAITDGMVDDLRSGNFTGAFTGAIEQASEQLAGEARGAGDGAAPGVGDVDDGDERPAGVTRAGADDRDVADGGGRDWLAPVLVLGGAGAGVWWWRRRRGGTRAEAPAAPEPARALDARLRRLREALVEDSPSLARLVLAYESMGDEAMLAVSRRHEEMLARRTALEATAAALAEEAPAGDDAALERRYAAPLAEADELLAYADALAREADHAEMLEDRAPVIAVEARKTIARAAERYAAAAAGLDLPPPERALAFATGLVDAAEAALGAGQRISAGRLAEDATEIAERLGRLPRDMAEADAEVAAVADVFPRLEGYAESSWADVRGNGSEADDSLDAAAAMLRRVVEAETPAFGTDAAGGFLKSLDAVAAEVTRARSLVGAIRERLGFLDRARGDASTAIAAAEKDIDAALAWIRRADVDPDVGPAPVQALETARAELASARLGMGAPRPDWIAILRQVAEADRAADEALAAARAEHERVAARRRQLATARTEAEAAVDRAERFLAGHRGDASATSAEGVSAARAALGRAQGAVRAAEAATDAGRLDALGEAVDALSEARRLADVAYEAVAGDVARLERQRDRNVPRRDWLGPSVPIPMDPWPRRGGAWSGGPAIRPPRPSSWGSGPGGGSIRIGGGSSPRRGGGRGW